jgi:hypothetical protein
VARRGFLGRLRDTAERIATRVREAFTERPEEPRERYEEPPEEPSDRGRPAPPTGRNAYDDIWRDTVTRGDIEANTDRSGYSEREQEQLALEIFLSLPNMMDEDIEDRLNFWQDFLEVWYGDGDRETFWGEFGVDKIDFPWELWQESRGYSKRK